MAAQIIAVIEDNPQIVQLFDMLLGDEGYMVISYAIGADAHQFILRTMPDLIILDWWLESADAGSMVLGLLELDPATRHIPVVICSAHLSALRSLRGTLEHKGYHVVPKPVDPPAFIATIQSILDAPNERHGSSQHA